jgi:hypothetical protein
MKESRRTAARVLAPFVVVLALVAFFVWNNRTVSSHLAGMERADRILSAYFSPGPPLLRRSMGISDKVAIFVHQSQEYWLNSWSAHQAALLQRGYLTKSTITLTNQSLVLKQVVEQVKAYAQQRFPDSTNIAAIWTSANHTITMVVPTQDIGQWREFIAELDKRNP